MPDREQRDNIEQALVSELNKSSVVATAAMAVFGPNGFKGLTEEQVSSKLKESGYSSVIIVSLVAKNKERDYYPGNYYVPPYPVGYYSLYYRRYAYAYDYMYTPGYVTTSTNYVLQAELYTIDTDQLIYSAQTKTYDPVDAQDLAASFSKAIVTELQAKNIIPTK
jgi:hypothetical protein